MLESIPKQTRRELIRSALGTAAVLGAGGSRVLAHTAPIKTRSGKAEACILIWLGGGASQIDTFDPKGRGDGKKIPGCYYEAIDTAIPGVRVSEHLANTAKVLDRCVIVRTVGHEINSEHAAAANLMHTGRRPSETIVYPSIGSIISHQLGPRTDDVPPYVVMGYPNGMRDPGFLGAKHGYVYLTQLETGPNGLVRAPDVDSARQKRREALLGALREGYVRRNPGDPVVEGQAAVSAQGFRIASPRFLNVFDLSRESSSLRQSYGGEFGQRCLAARRIVQAGARFVEVSFNLNFLNGTGWDTHNEGQINQHLLIRDLDQALAALILDLERTRLLERTLVVVATEFGRPPEFDAGGGRGHQSASFSCLLAGGSIRAGRVVGVTDDLSRKAIDRPVAVPDFHATVHAALGIDPAKNLFAGSRPVPITDYGRPIAEILG